jgi:hypothetical protein
MDLCLGGCLRSCEPGLQLVEIVCHNPIKGTRAFVLTSDPYIGKHVVPRRLTTQIGHDRLLQLNLPSIHLTCHRLVFDEPRIDQGCCIGRRAAQSCAGRLQTERTLAKKSANRSRSNHKSAVRIAHHPPAPQINLAFFTWSSLDHFQRSAPICDILCHQLPYHATTHFSLLTFLPCEKNRDQPERRPSRIHTASYCRQAYSRCTRSLFSSFLRVETPYYRLMFDLFGGKWFLQLI